MNKIYPVIALVLLVCMLIIPTLSFTELKTDENTAKYVNATPSKDSEKGVKIKLYRTDSQKVETCDINEYLIGVIAGEMSAEYESEALKAQCVASYTMYLYRKAENSEKEYDITDDYSKDQSYLDKTERKEKWGDNFETYEKKICTHPRPSFDDSDRSQQLRLRARMAGGGLPSAENLHAL